MKNKKTIQKILIGLVIAIALLVAYAVVNKKDTLSVGTSTLSSLQNIGSLGQVQQTDTALRNAEILKVLGNIENIELKDDIFLNPVFRELVDSRFTIPPPLRVGRPNPFLPIGFDAIANASEQSTNIGTSSSDAQFLESSLGSTTDANTNEITDTQGDTTQSTTTGFFGDFANSDNQ